MVSSPDPDAPEFRDEPYHGPDPEEDEKGEGSDETKAPSRHASWHRPRRVHAARVETERLLDTASSASCISGADPITKSHLSRAPY